MYMSGIDDFERSMIRSKVFHSLFPFLSGCIVLFVAYVILFGGGDKTPDKTPDKAPSVGTTYIETTEERELTDAEVSSIKASTLDWIQDAVDTDVLDFAAADWSGDVQADGSILVVALDFDTFAACGISLVEVDGTLTPYYVSLTEHGKETETLYEDWDLKRQSEK